MKDRLVMTILSDHTRAQTPLGYAAVCARVGRSRRRGSVLVLVMTLLSILFVIGVAFLASMNFEAEMIAAQVERGKKTTVVGAVADGLSSKLRDGLLGAPGVPFSHSTDALASAPFAEMPGVHNTFGPIEPYADGAGVYFRTFTDIAGLGQWKSFLDGNGNLRRRQPFDGVFADMNIGRLIETRRLSGAYDAELERKGNPLYWNSFYPELKRRWYRFARVDADGDGITDSLQVDAKLLGYSDALIDALSAQVNKPDNPEGDVFVGMRVIAHGGMVNLNASHPNLIKTVVNISDGCFGDPGRTEACGFFHHRPTHDGGATYSPQTEEPLLRRRALLPPRYAPPSILQGDPFLDPDVWLNHGADMAFQLMPPTPDGTSVETLYPGDALAHQFEPFPANACNNANPDPKYCYREPTDLWTMRMEPLTSFSNDPTGRQYDRKHLVTTISHDDLLSRGGRVSVPGASTAGEDILSKMREANRAMHVDMLQWNGELPLAFEYANYPHNIRNEALTGKSCEWATDVGCRFDRRKGRLQLSLAWLDQAINDRKLGLGADLPEVRDRPLRVDRAQRLVHDVFAMMLRNALDPIEWDAKAPDAERATCNLESNLENLPNIDSCASGEYCKLDLDPVFPRTGKCTSGVPYFDDVECDLNNPCDVPGEVCVSTDIMSTVGICRDVWTWQRHSQAALSRTAASLTANLFDFADGDGIPTRIALRSFDFTRGVCDRNSPGVQGWPCRKDSECGYLPDSCIKPPRVVGRDIDRDRDPLNRAKADIPIYVYGLERQPYITEVATNIVAGGVNGWAVELFNPYDREIDTKDKTSDESEGYFLYQVSPSATKVDEALRIALDVKIPAITDAGPAPFVTLISGAGFVGTRLSGTGLAFANGWTLFLVRRHRYEPNEEPTYIVVDQFTLDATGPVGNRNAPCPAPPCAFSAQRVVTAPSLPPLTWSGTPWTGTVGNVAFVGVGHSLGNWNVGVVDAKLHPVEVKFADTNSFASAYPTTGSMLLTMRHANRSLADYAPPVMNSPLPGILGGGGTVPRVVDLAFTGKAGLDGELKYKVPFKNLANFPQASPVTILERNSIDNGHLPVFDRGNDAPPTLDVGQRTAHHVPAHLTHPYVSNPDPTLVQEARPGDLTALPWGQMVFDYFTALPLSAPGPYPRDDPEGLRTALPGSRPKVDLGGLRVHGRINLNAAPWTVLSGLPFVPMDHLPTQFQASIRLALGFVSNVAVDPLNPLPSELSVQNDQAGTIGQELAQSIVAYRGAREISFFNGTTTVTTGDYGGDVPSTILPPPPTFGRGWSLKRDVTAIPDPIPDAKVRRGTGFMSVGELANVRHPAASANVYRVDSGVVGSQDDKIGAPAGNKNKENYVDAVAVLVALGDWVTVRSQVFTVYGVIRGEQADPNDIPDSPPPENPQRARIDDVDSRAIRFQETIDRLPTFRGRPQPVRIGSRFTTHYQDVSSD